MRTPAPHSPLFQLFGRESSQTVDCINRNALEQLLGILDRPLSACGISTLLRAPRAGYGKSHLLCRLQQALRLSHEFLPLLPHDGNRFDASSSLENVITQLTRPLPGGAGITPLDLLARKIFSIGLEPLVRSGEVPSQDRDSALMSLAQRPTETFDFHHPAAVTAHWARNHFDVLGPRLIMELSQILHSPMRDVTFWIETFFRYAITIPEHPGRLAVLLNTVAASTPSAAHDRLSTLLHMLSQWQRVVLVVDELEGLSADPDSALRLATFLTSLRHGAERVDVILSVNDDIWENAFVPRLSGGLLDRLSEEFVRLSPLTEDEAVALLQSRHPHAKRENLDQLQLKGDLFARAILRSAALHQPQPISETPQPATVPQNTSPFREAVMPQPEESFVTLMAGEDDFTPLPVPSISSPSPFSIVSEEDSPFTAASFEMEDQTFQQTPAAQPQSPFTNEPVTAETDRVSELLRQFRERYGHSAPLPPA